MNRGKYRQDLDNVIKILTDYSLLGEKNLFNFKNDNLTKYSKYSKEKSRKDNYFEYYKCMVENLDYDIILKDNSLFQFSNDMGRLRYAFYPSPDVLDYLGFLKEIMEADYTEVRDQMYDLYSDYINQSSEQTMRTPIRYDYDVSLYVENEHSASHIHFGFNKDFKINCDKILLPSLFVLFVIQNYYYDKWKDNKEIYTKYIYNLKYQCSEVGDDYFTILEKQMIFVK